MAIEKSRFQQVVDAVRARDGAELRAQAKAEWPSARKFMRHAGLALLAGLLGSVAAVVVMGVLRLWWGTLAPPELVGERILPLLSVDQFVTLLIRYAPNSKTGPLSQALLGQVVIGVLLGGAYAVAVRKVGGRGETRGGRASWLPGRRAWLVAGAFALGMLLLALALFWPVLGAGRYGDPVGRARLLTIAALTLTFAAFAATVALSYQAFWRVWGAWVEGSPTQPRKEEEGQVNRDQTATSRSGQVSRREALAVAGGTAIILAAGAFATKGLIAGYLARSNLSYEGHIVPASVMSAITPNKDFYIVSKNVLDPTVTVSRWRLEVDGLVGKPVSWTYDEALKLPAETRAVTLECISNGIGGRLLSTAQWRGFSLKTLLERAGGVDAPEGKHVVFTAVDGYVTSLPLPDLLEARTLLAYQMNGETLPERHGFPLRAIVPGRYGEQSAKWVTRVEITDHEVKGFYQSQGWSAAQLETIGRIDTPHKQASLGEIPISGVAFAGIRGIQQVEVSVDGGATWQRASLQTPLSDQTWVLWTWNWRPARARPMERASSKRRKSVARYPTEPRVGMRSPLL
jgi:DMSO/TMAO reductase YedYZ molybdopterin-dependent catalytic subunit/membrane protein implicated in regulation of membrane protease activity